MHGERSYHAGQAGGRARATRCKGEGREEKGGGSKGRERCLGRVCAAPAAAYQLAVGMQNGLCEGRCGVGGHILEHQRCCRVDVWGHPLLLFKETSLPTFNLHFPSLFATRYQGTADAVRHYSDLLSANGAAEDVLILAGDQL